LAGRLSRQDLWITAISIFELRYGIELNAKGRRRNQLEDSLVRVLDAGFSGRILNFDQEAANAAAFVSAKRRSSGHPNEIRDTLIAGIVISQRADLATRNVRHFQKLDTRLIDPWTD
jgi:predicted nucleic acid-binding protein